MITLLYNSHTVVPAHLSELEGLGLIEPDEQILVALDGVLLDSSGLRLSGPTLHDYCLVTNLRVVLWARDYGRHLCYAFPLAELASCDGAGLDPLHATLQLNFVAAGEEDAQQFTLTLLPLANLQAALALLHAASTTARAMAEQGYDARAAGPEVMAVLSEQIYGHVDGPRPNETPYRWPGADTRKLGARATATAPTPAFLQDPASLPPGQVYAAGRLARSAWDTLRRSIKEAELPFDLSSSSLRELTDTVRAINDLVHTVSGSPAAQQMAMAFINRGGAQGAPQPPAPAPDEAPEPAAWMPTAMSRPVEAEAPREYREIPLRRRGAPATPPAPRTPPPPANPAEPEADPDWREIPMRRRAPIVARPFSQAPKPVAISGSGDAGSDDSR